MRALILTMTLIGMSFLTVACNTFEGAGQDIQKGGKAIERAADRNK